jgi:hypothetical protein
MLPRGTVSTLTYLLNHVDLKIKLRRSRDVIALMADADNYKIIIKDLALFVRNVQLGSAVRMGHVKALEKTSCKFSHHLYRLALGRQCFPGRESFVIGCSLILMSRCILVPYDPR